MNEIIGYLTIYISILFGSISISNILNKRIESCIILDIFLKLILLYIFGLIGQLYIGTIIINIISIIIGIIIIIKNRKNDKFKNNILTTGMIFFTIIYFLFIIFTYKKISNVWDEYSYWSVACKKMFYSNQLLNPNLQVIYPPFPTVLQYYFTATIGKYSQGIELFANIILGFSLLIPLFERIKKNRKISNICLSIIIICIPAIFQYVLFYQAIYVDSILGMLIGYIFYQLYFEKNNNIKCISLILALIVLTLTKITGFYIAIILIGVIALNKIINIIQNIKKDKENKKDSEKISKEKLITILKNNRKFILNIFIIVLIIFLTYFSWSIYTKDYGQYKDVIEKEYQDGIDQHQSVIDALKTIITTIFGSNNDTVNYDTSNRTLLHSLYLNYSIINPVKISIVSFAFIYIIASLIIYKFFINKDNKSKFKNIIISILIGLIVYTAFIQLAYITKFGIDEALRHASIDRYINTYLLGMFIFLISIILEKFEESDKNIRFKYIIAVIIILMITPLNIITDATFASGNENATTRYYLTPVINAANCLKEKLNSNDRVYLINQEADKKVSSWQLKYFLVPKVEIKMTRKSDKNLEEFKYSDGTLKEKWKKLLYDEYDYIYVYKTDEYFNEFSKDIFKNTTVKNYTLYKIEKENINKEFKLIEVN